jgi:hypothetical protein
MLQIKIGLMDTTRSISPDTMAAAAAALNIQVTRDLPQYWPINASVEFLPGTGKVPQGVWPVQIVKSLPPGEGGFHLTRHNQPYAKVIATPGSDDWTIDASHEVIEMLVDPAGNRLQTSAAIEITHGTITDGPGQFEYLVEACDPCEANGLSYPIEGIAVSDFITPHFYEPHALPGTRYSFNGALTKPRQILPGGYISWIDPQSDEVQQLLFVNPNQPPIIKNLGSANGASLRAFSDAHARTFMLPQKTAEDATHKQARANHRKALAAAAEMRAKHYS